MCPRTQAQNVRTHGPQTTQVSEYWHPDAGWATPPHDAQRIPDPSPRLLPCQGVATVYTIPVAARTAHQTQTTTLDGRRFRISLDWNQRIQRWFVSLATDEGVWIFRSKGLVLGSDILRQTRYLPEAPQGALVLLDLQDQDVEASLDSLGARHRIFYFGS